MLEKSDRRHLRATVVNRVKMNLITAVSCLILGTKLSIKFRQSKISLCRGHSISSYLLDEHERASGKSSVVSMVEYDPPVSSFPFSPLPPSTRPSFHAASCTLAHFALPSSLPPMSSPSRDEIQQRDER